MRCSRCGHIDRNVVIDMVRYICFSDLDRLFNSDSIINVGMVSVLNRNVFNWRLTSTISLAISLVLESNFWWRSNPGMGLPLGLICSHMVADPISLRVWLRGYQILPRLKEYLVF